MKIKARVNEWISCYNSIPLIYLWCRFHMRRYHFQPEFLVYIFFLFSRVNAKLYVSHKKYKEISNFMCISERIVSINTPTHAMSWCWFVHVFPEYIPMWYMNLIYISDTVNKICLSKLRNCQNSYHE